MKKTIPGHIIMQLPETSGEKKIFKASREGYLCVRHVMYTGPKVRWQETYKKQ
jgi:hypothetical protein